MAFSVVMPALEMAQETGKLLAWRKKDGDRVVKGEPLLDIETDKAVVEVEAPADGILAGIKAAEGSDIPVGQTIAWIVAPGESLPFEEKESAPRTRAAVHSTKAELAHAESAIAGSPSPATLTGLKISPKARRLAKELGVDVAVLTGSGPDGEILASDVQAASAKPVTAVQEDSSHVETPSSIGRIMAERTTQSWTTIPHFFVTREIEATALNNFRERIVSEIERTRQVRVTHTDILIALAARVLLKHPRLNASWSTGGIKLHGHVHIGVAIAVNDGVVAVVIRNAHVASVSDIATKRAELADRARTGKLRPPDIADATFTISNLGMYRVDQFSAIITPPQAAILAVGSISERVVALEGKPVVRPMMTVTISCDHRVIDGARAAQFLSDLAAAIQDPQTLLE